MKVIILHPDTRIAGQLAAVLREEENGVDAVESAAPRGRSWLGHWFRHR